MMTPEEREAVRAFGEARERIDAEISALLERYNGPNVNFARMPLAQALKVLRDPGGPDGG